MAVLCKAKSASRECTLFCLLCSCLPVHGAKEQMTLGLWDNFGLLLLGTSHVAHENTVVFGLKDGSNSRQGTIDSGVARNDVLQRVKSLETTVRIGIGIGIGIGFGFSG